MLPPSSAATVCNRRTYLIEKVQGGPEGETPLFEPYVSQFDRGKTHDNEGSPGVVIDPERMNLLMVALRESQGECDECGVPSGLANRTQSAYGRDLSVS